MGKDYPEGVYRKTYSGEYVTSYKNARLQREQNEQRRKEYEIVSKKLNKQVYVNPGKPTSNSSVNPAGVGGHVSTVGDTPPRGERSAMPKMSTPKTMAPPVPIAERGKIEQSRTVSNEREAKDVPPPFVSPTQKTATPKARREGDFSYIDIHSTKHPVIVSGSGYQDTYTGEMINAGQARQRLEYAGYAVLPKMPIGRLILFCFIALPIPVIGPLILMSLASSMKKKELTEMSKNSVGGRRLTFSMPATTAEQEENQKRGNVCSFLAVGFFVVQFYSLFT